METYCVSFKKNNASKSSSVGRTKQDRSILVSNCVTCSRKKSRFIKFQEGIRLLSTLGLITPLSNIPLLDTSY